MELENTKKASKIRTIYMLVPLLAVAFVASTYLFTEVRDLKYILITFIFLIVYFVLMALPGFYFVSFYAGPDKIRIRYKSLAPFRTSNNSILIKSENFRKYELKTSLAGLKKSLILFQETPGGLARFPKVSLTALSAEDRANITKALELILAINKSAN